MNFEVQTNTIDSITFHDSTQDVMNRIVLAFFGKDALILFETKNITDIQSISNDEIEKAVQPFPYIYPNLQPLFYSVLSISIGLFVTFFCALGFYGLFLTQSEGEFLGKQWDVLSTFLKFLIAITFLTPMYGKIEQLADEEKLLSQVNSTNNDSYSIGQSFIFKTVGYGNHLGKIINKRIIDESMNFYPSLKLPNDDAKTFSGAALINYQLCLKQYDLNAKTIILKGMRLGNSIIINNDSNNCPIYMKVELDDENIKYLNNSDELKSLSSIYEDIQMSKIKSAIESSLDLANKASNILISKYDMRLDSSKNSKSNSLDIYTNKLDNQNNVELWQKTCSDLFNNNFSNGLNDIEKSQFGFLASRCIAYNINNKLILDKSSNLDYYLNSNYLDNSVELCSHDYSYKKGSKSFKGKTIINSDKNLSNEISDGIANFESKTLSLKSCIDKTCTLNGDLYLCSNAISLHKQYNDKMKFTENGIFSMAVSIFDLNTKFNSSDSKKIFNSFNVKNEVESSGTSKLGNLNFEFNHTNLSNSEEYFIDDSDFSAIEEEFFTSKVSGQSGQSTSDLLGFKRLVTCGTNPLSISNGYSCGTVLQEYSSFGHGLLNVYAHALISKTVINGLKRKAPIYKKSKQNSISEQSSKTGMIKTVGTSAISGVPVYIGGEEIVKTFNYLTNFSEEQTDEFGFLNGKQKNYINEGSGLVIGGLATISGIGSYFDSFLDLLLYVGVLMCIIIPLTPFYFFISLGSEFVLLLFSTLVFIGFWSLLAMKPSNDDSNEVIKLATNTFLALLIKIPFLVISIYLSFTLANILMPIAMQQLNLSSVLKPMIFDDQIVYNVINMIVCVVVYAIVIYSLILKTLYQVIHFYDFSTGFMFGDVNFEIDGDSIENTSAETRSIFSFMKLK
ncbi:hypothetical protein [Shewanella baltica]|uniref:hypothetical protein n=1 Tax=Shewanella baltica TaxID=62322 RepID=UPI003D79CE69